ncbi:MAG: RtcB family protein, partial [Desulfobacterales bacterium]|nr:RtcB family protein [Desulfobacterales bacterium]
MISDSLSWYPVQWEPHPGFWSVPKDLAQTFGSTCHGAGRTMSRKKAKKTIHGATLREELEGRGIHVR